MAANKKPPQAKRHLPREQLEAWLVAYRDGDLDAFDQLYDGISRIICAALSKMVRREDISDLLQETFLRIHRHIRSYRAGGNPLSWMLTIAQNVAFDYLAAGKTQIKSAELLRQEWATNPLHPTYSLHQNSMSSEPDFDVEAVLAALSHDDRALVHERFTDELSLAQMAARRKISEATLRQRLSRVIRGLRKRVQS